MIHLSPPQGTAKQLYISSPTYKQARTQYRYTFTEVGESVEGLVRFHCCSALRQSEEQQLVCFVQESCRSFSLDLRLWIRCDEIMLH
jgi:hypothetical protein